MNHIKFWIGIGIICLNQTIWAQNKIQFIDSTLIINPSEACLSCISFRGASVPNNQTAWLSGSKGSVVRSIDGGKTFELIKIPDFDSIDFRSIY